MSALSGVDIALWDLKGSFQIFTLTHLYADDTSSRTESQTSCVRVDGRKST